MRRGMRIDPQTAMAMMTNLHELRRQRGEPVAQDAVSFFGFTPGDVQCVHFWKDEKEGIWFRLFDNRVVGADGGACETDLSLYEPPASPAPILF
jgi:hypothetical protein